MVSTGVISTHISWYQFLWVFLCSAATFTAYRLTLAARRGKGGPR
ncbi:MAG: hypothetical protein JWO46_2372 [Nocardioidaceae bacterium]|nr:hypothetical protein [Nocardioidaceae bacterium]